MLGKPQSSDRSKISKSIRSRVGCPKVRFCKVEVGTGHGRHFGQAPQDLSPIANSTDG